MAVDERSTGLVPPPVLGYSVPRPQVAVGQRAGAYRALRPGRGPDGSGLRPPRRPRLLLRRNLAQEPQGICLIALAASGPGPPQGPAGPAALPPPGGQPAHSPRPARRRRGIKGGQPHGDGLLQRPLQQGQGLGNPPGQGIRGAQEHIAPMDRDRKVTVSLSTSPRSRRAAPGAGPPGAGRNGRR